MALVFFWMTVHGPAWMTVTGMTLPSPSKTWLMPIFLPMIPSIMIILLAAPKAWISTSIPAGRSSFWSSSIVSLLYSLMSIRRLWIRISKCSRDFLSTWGDRRTQNRWIRVGSGIGPETLRARPLGLDHDVLDRLVQQPMIK